MTVTSLQATTLTSVKARPTKKIRVNQNEQKRFSALFPMNRRDGDAHGVYDGLKSDDERCKFFYFLTVLQLREPEEIGISITSSVNRINPGYVQLCRDAASKRRRQ